MGSCRAADLCHVQPVSFWEKIKGAASIPPQKLTLCVSSLYRLTLLICHKFCVSFALFQVGVPSSHKKDNGLFWRHLITFLNGMSAEHANMLNALTYKGERGHIWFKEKGTNAEHADLVNTLKIQRWARSHLIQRKGDECRTCWLGECT
jgi:hypothetical protein